LDTGVIYTLRVLIVDDHTLVRQGLRTMLELDEDINVVGEASNGSEALEKVNHLMPDVTLMDIRMPGENGIEIVKQIKRTTPQATIVMLTMYDFDEYIIEAVRAGATGYVLKSCSREDLIKVIKEAYSGKSFMPPETLRKLLNAMHNDKENGKSANYGEAPLEYRLTERENQVLGLIAKGMTNRQIATSLRISEETTKTHIKAVYRKCKLKSRAEAIVLVLNQE
jgi:DNA-binding NarL/FixJ family response regulator